MSAEHAFANRMKVESGRHLFKHRVVTLSLSLVLRDSLRSFVRRFMLPFRYCILVFLLLLWLFCGTEIVSVQCNKALIWRTVQHGDRVSLIRARTMKCPNVM